MLCNKVERFIKYHKSLNHQDIKIVMTNDFYQRFIKELFKDSVTHESTDLVVVEEDKKEEFMGCPIEINDKIATDFYVCEII